MSFYHKQSPCPLYHDGKQEIVVFSNLFCYNKNAVTPDCQQKGGVAMSDDAICSFFTSVVASIVSYYICKWLDKRF